MNLLKSGLSLVLLTATCCAGDLYEELQTDDISHLVNLANQGDPIALTKLGLIAQAGVRGAKIDAQYALGCFEKAAAQEFPPALSELGHMHAGGHGVTANTATAFKYYLRAAKLGHPRAMDTVGYLYKNGEGVPRNYIESYRWSTLAAASNVYGADLRVNELERLITPAERVEAQRLALATHQSLAPPLNATDEKARPAPESRPGKDNNWLRTFVFRYEAELLAVLFVAALVTIITILAPTNQKPPTQKQEKKATPSFLKYWAIATMGCFLLWAFLGWGNSGMEGLGKAIGAGLIMAPISGFVFGGIYWLIRK